MPLVASEDSNPSGTTIIRAIRERRYRFDFLHDLPTPRRLAGSGQHY